MKQALLLFFILPAYLLQAQDVITTVYFRTNEFVLADHYKHQLDSLLAADGKVLQVKLSGHTDNVGSDAYNQALSVRRTQSVYNYLVEKGMNTGIISKAFYGKTQPLLPNTNEFNRSRNRRTEIVLTIQTADALSKRQMLYNNDTIDTAAGKSTQLSTIRKILPNGVIITYLGDKSENGGAPSFQIFDTDELQRRKIQTIKVKKPGQAVDAREFPYNLFGWGWICGGNIPDCNRKAKVQIPILDSILGGPLDSILFFKADPLSGRTRWIQIEQEYTIVDSNGIQYLTYETNKVCELVAIGWQGYGEPYLLKLKKLKAHNVEAIMAQDKVVYEPQINAGGYYTIYNPGQKPEGVKLDIYFANYDNPATVKKFPLSACKHKKNSNIFVLRKKDMK